MALTFALVVVLPLLTSVVILPVSWLPGYAAKLALVIGVVLAATAVASVAALGLLVLLGAGYTVLGVGGRPGFPAIAPLAVTMRRALLILLRPAILIALPPFALPMRTAAGKWVAVFSCGNLVAVAVVYPVIWLNGGVVPLPYYIFVTNVTVVIFVLLCWLAAWATKNVVAPSLKVFLDIFRYVSDPEYHAKLQGALNSMIQKEHARDRRSFFILSHSLGSVIAANSLVNSKAWRRDDRVLLVTMGSPLRRFFFRFLPDLYFPPSADGIGDAAAARVGSLRWVNVYRPWDQVGATLGLTRQGSTERSSRQWGRILTAHSNYWSDSAVHVRAYQAIRDIEARQGRGWQPNADWLTENAVMHLAEEHKPPGVAIYLFLTALLLAATPILFGVTSGVSRSQWNDILTQKEEDLERHGVIADASVVHRVIFYNTSNSSMPLQQRVYVVEFFEFRFRPLGGAEIVKKMELSRGPTQNNEERFFDPKALSSTMDAKGEPLLGQTDGRAVMVGRRLNHVLLKYDPGELADPDAMWILLPDFPPQPRTWLGHAQVIVVFSLFSLLAAVGGSAILLGGYFCFVYFLGSNPARIPNAT